MSGDDRQVFEEGVRTLTEVGGAFLSIPVAVVGGVVKSVGEASAGAAAVAETPKPAEPAPHVAGCTTSSRVSMLAPLISLVESFIRFSESSGIFLGGRANLPGSTPTAEAATSNPPRVRLFAAPMATTIYLVGDLAKSFKQGLQEVATRSRRRE